MEIDIASAIEEILDRRETVSIGGIGSLLLENLSAKFSKDGSSMTPPSAYLTFFDTQTKNKPLTKYIAKKYNISKEASEKAILKFNKSVSKALNKHGEVNIEGILKFEKKGKKIRMIPLKGYQEKYYKGLPEVDAKKLKKKKAKTTEVISTKKASTMKTATNLPKFKVKAAIPNPKFSSPKAKTTKTGIVSKEASAKVLTKKPETVLKKAVKETGKKEKTPAPVLVKKQAAEKPKSSIGSPVVIKKSAPVVPKTVTPKVETKPVVPVAKKVETPKVKKATTAAAATSVLAASLSGAVSSVKPAIATKDSASKEINLNDKLKQTKATTTPPKSSIAAASSSSVKAATTMTGSDKPSASVSKPSYTPVPPQKEGLGCVGPGLGLLGILLLCFLLWKGCNCIMQSSGEAQSNATEKLTEGSAQGDDNIAASEEAKGTEEIIAEIEECIIITGVFSDFRNVKRMEEKLLSQGYDVYTEEYGPQTRVGFRFDCSDEDLPEYLHKIRAKFAKKAWYLKPDLYVEYR